MSDEETPARIEILADFYHALKHAVETLTQTAAVLLQHANNVISLGDLEMTRDTLYFLDEAVNHILAASKPLADAIQDVAEWIKKGKEGGEEDE